MTGSKRYRDGDEEIGKTFKKLTTSFDNFINHLLLILLYFLFPFLYFSFLNYLTQCLFWHFLLPLNGDSFVTVKRVILRFFLHLPVYIYTFFVNAAE